MELSKKTWRIIVIFSFSIGALAFLVLVSEELQLFLNEVVWLKYLLFILLILSVVGFGLFGFKEKTGNKVTFRTLLLTICFVLLIITLNRMRG